MIHTWAYLSENEIIIIKRALLKKHLDKSGNEFFDPISASNGVRQCGPCRKLIYARGYNFGSNIWRKLVDIVRQFEPQVWLVPCVWCDSKIDELQILKRRERGKCRFRCCNCEGITCENERLFLKSWLNSIFDRNKLSYIGHVMRKIRIWNATFDKFFIIW